METRKIIANAITILELIGDLGEIDIAGIKNRTNLDSVNIGLALGWLVRGSDIEIDNKTGILLITSKY